jgi:hypothetical protein
MGTAGDWISVGFSAVFWGGWMLLWGRYWRSDTHIKPVLSFVYVLGLALASLWFGLVVTFHWRAFQWPLILLTVASIVGAAVVGRSARRKDRSAE